jgi:hypothetical protein
MRTVILMATLAVAGIAPLKAVDLEAERREAAQQALLNWLDCVECQSGELKELLAYKDIVEGPLIATLRGGLSAARRAEFEYQLRGNHRSSPSQTLTEDEYVRLFISNIEAGYQARSAIALGELGTEPALRALKEAADSTKFRPDVRQVARKALENRPPPTTPRPR